MRIWGARLWRMLAAAACVALAAACTSAPAQPSGPPPPAASPTAAPTASAPDPTSPPRREAVRIPYAAPSLGSLPLWLAHDGGFFEREGLDVAMEYIASGTTLAQALLSGDVGLASAGQETAIGSGVQGGDLVIVGVSLARPLFWISAQPGIRTPAELQGKRLAVSRFGSASDTVARYYLPTVGLQPERDVTILQLGGNPEMVAGLQTGAVDAAVLSPPAVFQARRDGATTLVDLGDTGLLFYQSALVSSRRFLVERPEAAWRVSRAYARAWGLLQDENASLAALLRYTGEPDRAVLVETYRAGLSRFPVTPIPRVEAIRQGLELLAEREPAARQFSPEQFIAPEYMVEAVATTRP